MTSRRRAMLAVGAGSIVMAALTASPAEATTNTTSGWGRNTLTGYCGAYTTTNTRGGYVVAAQSWLAAYGNYSSSVDNFWGSASNTALKTFQSNVGATADGCAGPTTWSLMQGFLGPLSGQVAVLYCPDNAARVTSYSSRYVANFFTNTLRGWKSDSGHGSSYPVASPVTRSNAWVFDSPSLYNC